MRITHNIPAIRAFNALNSTSKAMENSIRKLSSGLRINSAADDASGYAISEKMRSQVRGLNMAAQNTKDGISFLQTAEGSLETINSMLQRMRELAVQSANDTLTAQDRGFIQLEIDQLRDQIDNIAHNTQFNRKRLLDGSSQASWSSTDQNVQVNINGGLMITDEFNQKINNEGNYRLEITTDPGQAQVQKTNIMSRINESSSDASVEAVKVLFVLDVSSSMGGMIQSVKDNISDFVKNIKSEGVSNVEIGVCTYGTDNNDDPNFKPYEYSDGSLWSGDIDEIQALLEPITAPYSLDTNNYYAVKTAADYYRDSYSDNVISGSDVLQSRYMILVTDVDHRGTAGVGNTFTESDVQEALEGDSTTKTDDIQLTVIGPNTSSSSEFSNLTANSGGMMFNSGSSNWASDLVNTFAEKIAEDAQSDSTEPVTCPAEPDTKLSELTSFVSSSGVNLLEEPQKITLTQGTKTTSIYIDKGDTLTTFAKKINDAIANGLGQKEYTQDLNHFANYVYDDPIENTSESVPGTLVIRSVVTGREGEISFSGAEEILNALGLNTIQESQESKFTANVYDAHSNKCIASGITAAKADFRGLITPAVDVKIDSMRGINTLWSESAKKFIQTKGDTYETLIHLTDNTTILQTGANMGEDFIIQLDDSGAHAIGIDTVNVLTRESASQAITLIDRAIEKVASNRAKIGSYQNALEWTEENLETTSLNLSQAESRIRDADMAKEMMEFVRLQIKTESGTAMLSQANGMPRSVLSLLQ